MQLQGRSDYYSGINAPHTPLRLYCETVAISDAYNADTALKQLCSLDLTEISIVTEGCGIHQILNQAIPCKTGDVYIISPDIPHGYFNTGNREALVVKRLLFDPADWLEAANAERNSPLYCYGVFRDDPVTSYAMLDQHTLSQLLSHFDSIDEELKRQSNEWQSAVRALLSLLLITVGRYVNDTIKNKPNILNNGWSVVSATIRAANERFCDPSLTLSSIADSLYISTAQLSRLFFSVTGETFSKHLKKIRLSNACKLLENSDLTVETVMQRCGLKDIPSFYKGFRTFTGMTPSQYRSSKRATADSSDTKILDIISESIQKGKLPELKFFIAQALQAGFTADTILNNGILKGLNLIGNKFKNNEIFVPEVLIAANMVKMGITILKPMLVAPKVNCIGRACIGTVQGDLHDIGKNLVKMMLETRGIEVIDLGIDVPPEKFIQTAIEKECHLICCSALLTTTMPVFADVVKAANAAGIRDKVKIMIGGAPVNQEYCDSIGADCYTPDAISAAEAAIKLINEMNGE